MSKAKTPEPVAVEAPPAPVDGLIESLPAQPERKRKPKTGTIPPLDPKEQLFGPPKADPLAAIKTQVDRFEKLVDQLAALLDK